MDMKKYNKPEIEALALEIVDVIATSVETETAASLQSMFSEVSMSIEETGEQIQAMNALYMW